MKAPLLILLGCASCTSSTLSDSEIVTILNSTEKASEGYGSFKFGEKPASLNRLELLSDEGARKTYTRAGDSVAFGLVPIQGAQYTFKDGAFSLVSFSTEGFSNGNKLQGCLEQLYGPLTRVSTVSYQGRRGKATVLLGRAYDGAANVFILDERLEH